MVALLLIGMRSLAAMIVASAVVFIYKVAPASNGLDYATSVALIAAGALYALAG